MPTVGLFSSHACVVSSIERCAAADPAVATNSESVPRSSAGFDDSDSSTSGAPKSVAPGVARITAASTAGQQPDRRSEERRKCPTTIDVFVTTVIIPGNCWSECCLFARSCDCRAAEAICPEHLKPRTTSDSLEYSGSSKRELVTRGFFAVANVEATADENRMIPGLAFDGGNLCNLNMLLRIGFEQHQFAGL